jgi:hypothetical protein
MRTSERRIKHLMIQTLTKFEDRFPQTDNSKAGEMFKAELRTAFNDVIRAQRDEFHDYDVEYRPLKMTDDNTLIMTQTFMGTVQKIEFDIKGNVPSMRVYADSAYRKELDAVRSELGAGVLYNIDTALVLEIVGTESCINCVLPLMDKYRLHEGVRKKYLQWRDIVVKTYIGDRDVD